MVMSVLQKLHSKGHTIILVTHEQSTAEHAERIIRLRDGVIEKDSTDFTQRVSTFEK